MSWRMLLAGLLILCSTSASAARWVTYAIDPQATRISFQWIYMGMLSSAGQFSDVSGTIVYDLDQPDTAVVDVRIPVKTLKTFMLIIDRTLLGSGDYFLPGQYPSMRFRSSGLMHLEKDKGEFSLPGELTVNGITKPVTLSAKVPTNHQGDPLSSGALTATSGFRRSDFGMSKMLGIVGDEVKIILQVRAQKVPALVNE